MKNNVISERVKSFLASYPPFHFLSENDLEKLSFKIEILFFRGGAVIFEENQSPGNQFFLLRKGSVSLLAGNELFDQCDEGDIFGIRSLIVKKPYIATAQCTEDSIIYAIPHSVFENYLKEYPDVLMFFTAGFAAGKTVFREEEEHEASPNKLAIQAYGQGSLHGLNRIPTKNRKVYCTPDWNIQQAALKMKEEKVGSIVVVDEQLIPLGIITDKDFKTKVGTGQVLISESVSNLMSYPVKCISQNPTLQEVMLIFLKHNFHHLCVTQDGSSQTPMMGIISDHDLLVEQGDNPAFLMKKVRKASTMTELVDARNRLEKLIEDYLHKDLSIDFVAEITAEIEEAILAKIFEFSLLEMKLAGEEEPPCSFCWLALGSQGRREQLLRTDQDNALLFEEEGHQAYFLKLAYKITTGIETIGFLKCPADMMASNPKWCMSLAEWKNTFQSWISSSNSQSILHTTIFFDFSAVYGNAELAEGLKTHVFECLNELFLSKLALNALSSPPPLSFFRNILVEKDGAHKDLFDIKARAMVPLADLARLFTLYHKIEGLTNTYQRFEKIQTLEKEKSLFEEAALAYKFLMKLRTIEGISQHSDGRYVDIKKLNKLRRQVLKNIFETIAELQALVKVRFRTNLIS
jgi:CBS domain-containing protein